MQQVACHAPRNVCQSSKSAASAHAQLTCGVAGGNYQMLVGNLVSILLSAIITVTGSLIWPANYDFVSMREIALDDGGLESDLGEPGLSCCRP